MTNEAFWNKVRADLRGQLTPDERSGNFTHGQACRLAGFDRTYRACKRQGAWVVWCDVSQHHVEFDAAAIIAAR